MSLETLTVDAMVLIGRFLSARDLVALERCSRALHGLLRRDGLQLLRLRVFFGCPDLPAVAPPKIAQFFAELASSPAAAPGVAPPPLLTVWHVNNGDLLGGPYEKLTSGARYGQAHAPNMLCESEGFRGFCPSAGSWSHACPVAFRGGHMCTNFTMLMKVPGGQLACLRSFRIRFRWQRGGGALMTHRGCSNVPSGWSSPTGAFLVFFDAGETVDVAARAKYHHMQEADAVADPRYRLVELLAERPWRVYRNALPQSNVPDVLVFGLQRDNEFLLPLERPVLVRTVHLLLLRPTWYGSKTCNAGWGCCTDLRQFVPEGAIVPAALLPALEPRVVGYTDVSPTPQPIVSVDSQEHLAAIGLSVTVFDDEPEF